MTPGIDSFAVQQADSLAVQTADSLAVAAEDFGLVLEVPAQPTPPPAGMADNGSSWGVVALMALSCVAAVRLRKTRRFLPLLMQDLTSTRERHSIFDTTVRETSLMFLFCLMTVVAGGILLAGATQLAGSRVTVPEWAPIPEQLFRWIGCTAAVTGYFLFLWWACGLTGTVFADRSQTRAWLRGLGASTSLLALFWVPCALLCLCRGEWTQELLWIAAAGFVATKLAFILKGFRIFFIHSASWVLFLYYLCSLEAVPLVLTFVAAMSL